MTIGLDGNLRLYDDDGGLRANVPLGVENDRRNCLHPDGDVLAVLGEGQRYLRHLPLVDEALLAASTSIFPQRATDEELATLLAE